MTDAQTIALDDKLDVWYGPHLVGQIERRSLSVLDLGFRYSPTWRTAAAAFPVSTRMPLTIEEHPPGAVYPWFMNLLPDAGDRQKIGHILGLSEIDVFGMLKAMGDDLPGAFEIRAHGIPLSTLKPRVHALSEAGLADALRRLPERPLLVGESGVRMSLAGAQSKLAVVADKAGKVIGLPIDGAPSTHILKPRHQELHGSVENEAYCLRLADAVKLPAARCSIGYAEDIEYLLVERYDRVIGGDGEIHRLHQEDLCQATGFPPYLKYEWDDDLAAAGPNIRDCLGALGATTAPAANRARFVDFLIYNVLVGNVDAHSKNYSLLIRSNAVALAPLYDVMNGGIYQRITKDLAMTIGGQRLADSVHGSHWVLMAKENQLSGAAVKRRVKHLAEAVVKAAPKVATVLAAAGGHQPFIYHMLCERIVDRCHMVLANLDGPQRPL